MLDGRPFTFHKHEYLRLPYEDNHPDMVEMKGTQMGLTSKAMLRVMYAARYGGYRGILYLFPLNEDIITPRNVSTILRVRWAKPAISCGCKSRPAKAVAGRLGASLAGVMVTWGPKRRQRSCGVWD